VTGDRREFCCNAFLAAFYERLLDQGRRILHLHFEYLERTPEGGYLLTDEHDAMLEAIRARDVARADRLAHDHTRQFRDSFLEFLRQSHSRTMPLEPPEAGERDEHWS